MQRNVFNAEMVYAPTRKKGLKTRGNIDWRARTGLSTPPSIVNSKLKISILIMKGLSFCTIKVSSSYTILENLKVSLDLAKFRSPSQWKKYGTKGLLSYAKFFLG